MYKIKNMTKGKLLLGDLSIKLDAGEIIDLDAIRQRDQIEASMNLRVAEDNELIAVLHKDVHHPTTALAFDPTMFLEMERRIREQIVSQMQTPPTPQVVYQTPPQTTQNADVAQLTAQIKELVGKLGTGQAISPSQPSSGVEDYTPDADKLLEVHAKALKRMTQGASGHVEAKEQTSQSDVGDRASELDDFLK